jgi:hypothetical protein
VQYENGTVAPPRERLGTLAALYHVPLASLFVSHNGLIPVMTLLEQAIPTQLDALDHLLQQALAQAGREG